MMIISARHYNTGEEIQMKSFELRKELGITMHAFYKLRQNGVIPDPRAGKYSVRKFYSAEEVERIKARLAEHDRQHLK